MNSLETVGNRHIRHFSFDKVVAKWVVKFPIGQEKLLHFVNRNSVDSSNMPLHLLTKDDNFLETVGKRICLHRLEN